VKDGPAHQPPDGVCRMGCVVWGGCAGCVDVHVSYGCWRRSFSFPGSVLTVCRMGVPDRCAACVCCLRVPYGYVVWMCRMGVCRLDVLSGCAVWMCCLGVLHGYLVSFVCSFVSYPGSLLLLLPSPFLPNTPPPPPSLCEFISDKD